GAGAGGGWVRDGGGLRGGIGGGEDERFSEGVRAGRDGDGDGVVGGGGLELTDCIPRAGERGEGAVGAVGRGLLESAGPGVVAGWRYVERGGTGERRGGERAGDGAQECERRGRHAGWYCGRRGGV